MLKSIPFTNNRMYLLDSGRVFDAKTETVLSFNTRNNLPMQFFMPEVDGKQKKISKSVNYAWLRRAVTYPVGVLTADQWLQLNFDNTGDLIFPPNGIDAPGRIGKVIPGFTQYALSTRGVVRHIATNEVIRPRGLLNQPATGYALQWDHLPDCETVSAVVTLKRLRDIVKVGKIEIHPDDEKS